MDYRSEYEKWMHSPYVGQSDLDELANLSEDEIKLRFHDYLNFGTAGLRGVMVAGPNAMNIYTVAHATQALADLIDSRGRAADGVVIAYDSRNNSKLFAETAAQVLCANRIRTYLFDSLRPTPVLSFAVKLLRCVAGINITASHNPKQYNGYKAYWDDGAQISPLIAGKIAKRMKKINIFGGVASMPLKDAKSIGMLNYVSTYVDNAYLQQVEEQLIDRDSVIAAKNLSVVYSPLNGAGYKMVPEILKRIGINNLHIVKEQAEPDGDFPTTPFPNPEFDQVFEPGIKLANETKSDLIIATDPDADRMGISVRNKKGEFVTLTGNQTGVILLEYIISALKRTGKLPAKAYMVKSFVSTELATKIAKENGVKRYDVATGFKYIGEKINEKENKEIGREFIFGFEESCGYLRGTYARDKDAVVASMLVCEAAAYYSLQGKTLYDALQDIYKKYGFYREFTESVYMEGLDGLERMAALMESLRNDPPKELEGVEVDSYTDYKTATTYDMKTGESKQIRASKNDTLYYRLGSDVVVVRPSGTEPKIKFYYMVSDETAAKADKKLEKFKKISKKLVKRV